MSNRPETSKLPVDSPLFRNLEPIVPAAVWGAVAVDAQFRDAAEALDVVGPVEVEGRIAVGLAYQIARDCQFQAVAVDLVRGSARRLPSRRLAIV